VVGPAVVRHVGWSSSYPPDPVHREVSDSSEEGQSERNELCVDDVVMQTVRCREDVAEACAKPATATTTTTTTTTTATPTPTSTAAAAATAARPPPSSWSSSVSHRKVVAAPVPSTSAWSALPSSSGAAVAPAVSLFEMGGVSDGSFYCDYCNVFCNSESQLDAHCASAKHKLNISSDRERQWNFRPPPLIVAGGQYTLCSRSALHFLSPHYCQILFCINVLSILMNIEMAHIVILQ